tara:strand:- start:275 stop:769 length:495 start_codon:yes stop_codon:yes gene_type:complete
MNKTTDVFATCACCGSNEYEAALEIYHYNGGAYSFGINLYNYFPDLGEEHMSGEAKVFVLDSDNENKEHICGYCFNEQFESLKEKEKYTPKNCCVVCLMPTKEKIRVMSVKAYGFSDTQFRNYGYYNSEYINTLECSPVAYSKKHGHTLRICNECTKDIVNILT